MKEPKVYFNFVIDESWYQDIGDFRIENLWLLTSNRSKDEIIFMSSDPLKVVASIRQGFLTIPV